MSYIYEYLIPHLRTELGGLNLTPYRLHFDKTFSGHTKGNFWILNHQHLPLLSEQRLHIYSDCASLIVSPATWGCGDGVQGEIFWGNITINISAPLPPYAPHTAQFLDFLICTKV